MIGYPDLVFKVMLALAAYVGIVACVRHHASAILVALPLFLLYLLRLRREARRRERRYLRQRLFVPQGLDHDERLLVAHIARLGGYVDIEYLRTGVLDSPRVDAALDRLRNKGWVEYRSFKVLLLRDLP